jgi:hypothetical protein
MPHDHITQIYEPEVRILKTTRQRTQQQTAPFPNIAEQGNHLSWGKGNSTTDRLHGQGVMLTTHPNLYSAEVKNE